MNAIYHEDSLGVFRYRSFFSCYFKAKGLSLQSQFGRGQTGNLLSTLTYLFMVLPVLYLVVIEFIFLSNLLVDEPAPRPSVFKDPSRPRHEDKLLFYATGVISCFPTAIWAWIVWGWLNTPWRNLEPFDPNTIWGYEESNNLISWTWTFLWCGFWAMMFVYFGGWFWQALLKTWFDCWEEMRSEEARRKRVMRDGE